MRILLAMTIGFTVIVPGIAQRAGEFRIQVQDPSGNPMQAAGTLRALATDVEMTFETDAPGVYRFAMLPYARYRLEVFRDGFATQSMLIDVQAETPSSRTITIAIGASGDESRRALGDSVAWR
jgi:hypothetical protein